MEHKRTKKRTSRAAKEAQRRREERLRREKETAREARAIAREKQRRRQAERKARDSRAAQTAERQRQERKEDNRLDGLRQKQQREAKQRTKTRLSPSVWKRLAIVGAIAAAIILTMVIFFRVSTIEVVGNQYYSAAEIIAKCGVAEGDNLLTLSRGKIAGSILESLDYVKRVKVARRLPNGIILTVTEYPATYAVADVLGDYYLISADGKAMEKTNEKGIAEHVLIKDVTIKTPVLGENVNVAAQNGQEVKAQGQFTALTALLNELEAAELIRQVASVSVPASYDISLWYEDRFEVELGTAEQLDYKLELLKTVISREASYTTGSIDLTLEEGSSPIVRLN